MLCNERIMGDFLDRFQMGRASYELKADESEIIRAKFNTSSPLYNSPHPTPVQLLTNAKNAKEFCAWKAQHPSILEHFDDFTSLLHGKRLAVFLDYDGTLTPIVKDPDRAFMPEQMRAAVRRVAQLFPTSIISGRGREKVEGFVQLKELFYAGSHGMDIVGPKGAKLSSLQCCSSSQQDATDVWSSPPNTHPHKSHFPPPVSSLPQANSAPGDEQRLAFQPAAKYAPIMDSVFQALTHRVQEIPGASVEHNKFCVSVHFRNCSPDSYDAVVAAVKDTLHDHSNLKASRGRKVLEIQPQVDWGKGRALSHMLQALSLDDYDDVIPIYLGDDRTDEDAFKVLKQRGSGFGVLISNKMKDTDAKYTLTDPSEVMAFLTRLVEWGDTPDNAWHTHHSCTGWSLKQQPPSHTPPPPPTGPAVSTSSSHISTDRPDSLNADVTLNGKSESHSSGPQHRDSDREQSSLTSSTGSSPGHSPNSGSAFATVRHFHGLPVAAGTSDRAMPASQWLTKTDAFSQPKPEHAPPLGDTAPSEAAAAVCLEGACENQAGGNQQDTVEDEYSQMGFVKEGFSNHDQQEAKAAGTGSIEAEGRPPTAAACEEEGSAPPSRSSLDHYLNQTFKDAERNNADDGTAPASHMGQWDNAVTESSLNNSHYQPKQAAKSDKGIPDGKRLTALLEGHEGHHASDDDADDDISPPGISNAGESSLAGYQSPFESLAHGALMEETDSVKAEDGSVKSLNMAPSM